jgi:hypothetical protein
VFVRWALDGSAVCRSLRCPGPGVQPPLLSMEGWLLHRRARSTGWPGRSLGVRSWGLALLLEGGREGAQARARPGQWPGLASGPGALVPLLGWRRPARRASDLVMACPNWVQVWSRGSLVSAVGVAEEGVFVRPHGLRLSQARVRVRSWGLSPVGC